LIAALLRRWWSALAILVALSSNEVLIARPALAHEVLPTISDFAVTGNELNLTMSLDIEALIAEVNMSSPTATGDSESVATYEALRALPAEAISARFKEFWPTMVAKISVTSNGERLIPSLRSMTVPATAKTGLARTSSLAMTFLLPSGAQSVAIGWDPTFGPMVLRQNGVSDPYDGYIDPGTVSPPILLTGGDAPGALATFFRYIPIGFDHIVPKGLDHILFILGLFLFNLQLRPLLLQVSAFTAAHTITLAAAATGIVTVPPAIVEPAIAASIVYIAIENIIAKGASQFRLSVVFLFGLLHGLGFASVLQEFGLPEGSFLAGLLGFNLGVEFGQIAVVASAFLLVGLWFKRHRLYRAIVVVPGSALIGLIGATWFFERLT
jgi:hypothetical protein